MTYREDFSYLSHFFSCYFHEDWTEEYKNVEMAIESYVDDEGSSEANHVLHDLDRFLSLNLADTEIRALMSKEFCCNYYIDPAGGSMGGWLHWVRDTLAKYATEKAAHEKNSQG
jgi:hypothetical protein